MIYFQRLRKFFSKFQEPRFSEGLNLGPEATNKVTFIKVSWYAVVNLQPLFDRRATSQAIGYESFTGSASSSRCAGIAERSTDVAAPWRIGICPVPRPEVLCCFFEALSHALAGDKVLDGHSLYSQSVQ